jgi:hypothetical protein
LRYSATVLTTPGGVAVARQSSGKDDVSTVAVNCVQTPIGNGRPKPPVCTVTYCAPVLQLTWSCTRPTMDGSSCCIAHTLMVYGPGPVGSL